MGVLSRASLQQVVGTAPAEFGEAAKVGVVADDLGAMLDRNRGQVSVVHEVAARPDLFERMSEHPYVPLPALRTRAPGVAAMSGRFHRGMPLPRSPSGDGILVA